MCSGDKKRELNNNYAIQRWKYSCLFEFKNHTHFGVVQNKEKRTHH